MRIEYLQVMHCCILLQKKNTLSLCLNNNSKYLLEIKTVCLDFSLLAARSWSLVSVWARYRSTPVWTARGAESSEGQFSRFLRTWQINSYSDWNTLSFNWSLGHLNFCSFFFWNEPRKPQKHADGNEKMGRKHISPGCCSGDEADGKEREKKKAKLRKSSQRLALLPRSAAIVGLTPSKGSLWVCGVFPAWLRGHSLTVQSHPSLKS